MQLYVVAQINHQLTKVCNGKYFDMVICLWMGKTYAAKSLLGDFKVTTPENPLLSKQAVTSKGIQYLLPTYIWTLTPITNWTCSVVVISPFQCTASSMWLTNRANPSSQLNHQIEKDVGCKVLQFITQWRSWSCLVIKPYDVQNTVASSRERRTRAN